MANLANEPPWPDGVGANAPVSDPPLLQCISSNEKRIKQAAKIIFFCIDVRFNDGIWALSRLPISNPQQFLLICQHIQNKHCLPAGIHCYDRETH